jgi:hypothetical protein
MDKDSKSVVSQTQPESTPKRASKWDPTPMAKRDLNDGPMKMTDRTPSRAVEQTPSRFS